MILKNYESNFFNTFSIFINTTHTSVIFNSCGCIMVRHSCESHIEFHLNGHIPVPLFTRRNRYRSLSTTINSVFHHFNNICSNSVNSKHASYNSSSLFQISFQFLYSIVYSTLVMTVLSMAMVSVVTMHCLLSLQ